MAEVSFNRQHEFKTSRSGRLLIPRLKCWTGERVVVRKRGIVEVLDGVPDCTSTFQSERILFKMSPTKRLSQTLNFYKSPELPQTKASKSFSEYQSNLPPRKIFRQTEPKSKAIREEKVPQKYMKENRNAEICKISNVISLSGKKSPQSTQTVEASIRVRKSRSPSPRKNLRKKRIREQEEVDIFGPEFQPYVRLVRLLPEEILSLTLKKTAKKVNVRRRNTASSNLAKQTPPKLKTTKAKRLQSLTVEENDVIRRKTNRCQPRTVRETQKMLSLLQQPIELQEMEDEAASTAAFFQNSPCRAAMKQLNEAVDILNDDFESDDNLSIRTLSERESSPMSSAVSPIGSIHETDAEMSGREDGLLRGSPALGNPSSFQRARLLHRTLKDKAKLMRAKLRQRDDLTSSPLPVGDLPHFTGTESTSGLDQLQQLPLKRALEKEWKLKSSISEKWDFSTYYRGNLLHVSVNSDSEESSIDSLDYF